MITRTLAIGRWVWPLQILFGFCTPAEAHPHVFVKARADVVLAAGGGVRAIRHAWTLDALSSAFILRGGAEPGTDAPTASDRFDLLGLAPFDYYTVAKSAGQADRFGPPADVWSEPTPDGGVTLHFTLPLTSPASAVRAFTFLVYDPAYSLAFDLDASDSVTLSGATTGCSVSVFKPKPLDVGDTAKLTRSVLTNLSPGSDFGIKLAARAIIACP